jgi:hypothetical protein
MGLTTNLQGFRIRAPEGWTLLRRRAQSWTCGAPRSCGPSVSLEQVVHGSVVTGDSLSSGDRVDVL